MPIADELPYMLLPGGLRLFVRVTPRARKVGFQGFITDAGGRTMIKLSVSEAPEDGKANDAVIALLAKNLKVAKSAVTIQSGMTGRHKEIILLGDPRLLQANLDSWAGIDKGNA